MQLENGYTFYDYNIKLNDVIQLMITKEPEVTEKKEKSDNETQSKNNVLNDKQETDQINYIGKIIKTF